MNRRPLLAAALALALVAVARADENPLAKAKVGEWIIDKTVIAGATSYQYVFISKVDGKKVTVVGQPLAPDMKTAAGAAQARTIDTEKPLAASKDEKKLSVAEEEVEVKGKKLRCKKTETVAETKEGKLATTTWTCLDVPVYGRVRQIVKDKDGKELLRTDLVDWGAEGGKERPVEKTDKGDKDGKSDKK